MIAKRFKGLCATGFFSQEDFNATHTSLSQIMKAWKTSAVQSEPHEIHREEPNEEQELIWVIFK